MTRHTFISAVFILFYWSRLKKTEVREKKKKMNNNSTEMNHSGLEEEDEGEVFLGESDVLHEIDVDEEGSYFFRLFFNRLYVCMYTCVTLLLSIQIFLRQMMMIWTMMVKNLVKDSSSLLFPQILI